MNDRTRNWLKALATPNKPDEYEAKQLLSHLGIEIPAAVRLHPEDEIAIDFDGPYVAKVCSADILHKTDQKGVLLGLDPDALPRAVEELRGRFEGAPILVEQMVASKGPEFIIGALVDPTFGPSVMVGAGGILTELYKDVAFRLLPCREDEAARMLDELTVSAVLRGFRGLDLDKAALAKTISAVGGLIDEVGEIFNQLDINPIVYSQGRWVALDAKLILHNT